MGRNGVSNIVKRHFGGLPVVDAQEPLRIFLQECDAKGARQKSPGECLLAKACQRQLGCSKVMFLRTAAYVDLPDANGQRRCERFLLSEPAKRLVASFDKGEGIIANGGVALIAPKGSKQLEHMQKSRRKLEKAIKAGKHVRKKSKKIGAPREIFVRNGTGKIHTI